MQSDTNRTWCAVHFKNAICNVSAQYIKICRRKMRKRTDGWTKTRTDIAVRRRAYKISQSQHKSHFVCISGMMAAVWTRTSIRSDQSIVISLYICFSGLQNGSRFIRNDSSFVSSHFCYYFSCHFVKFWKIEIAIFWPAMQVGFGDHDIGSPLRLPWFPLILRGCQPLFDFGRL